ncbi:S49 family peptidase [Kaistella sp.]|uniref:S49 family peptidase n=1 Tax=Kaistella sp. TaxID=2782235 RepID=UPI002F95905E
MKTNTLVYDLLRSKWLINTANLPEYEKLANRFLAGEYKGDPIDRKAFKASYENGSDVNKSAQDEKKAIGYLQMIGPIATYGDMCTYGADDYLEALRYMNNSDKISAIVIDVDGPGGAVPAINAFKDFALEKKKPIVVLCNDLCSLHYWMSCLIADHIMAKGSISPCIGSIGATCILLDAREAMAKEGYKVMIINAPGSELKNKAMQDFYAGKDEEFIKRLESELKPIRDAFVADVKEAMPNISDDARIFGADTFNATEALSLGMIHSIGNEKKAFEMARALAELNDN